MATPVMLMLIGVLEISSVASLAFLVLAASTITEHDDDLSVSKCVQKRQFLWKWELGTTHLQ